MNPECNLIGSAIIRLQCIGFMCDTELDMINVHIMSVCVEQPLGCHHLQLNPEWIANPILVQSNESTKPTVALSRLETLCTIYTDR